VSVTHSCHSSNTVDHSHLHTQCVPIRNFVTLNPLFTKVFTTHQTTSFSISFSIIGVAVITFLWLRLRRSSSLSRLICFCRLLVGFSGFLICRMFPSTFDALSVCLYFSSLCLLFQHLFKWWTSEKLRLLCFSLSPTLTRGRHFRQWWDVLNRKGARRRPWVWPKTQFRNKIQYSTCKNLWIKTTANK